MYTSKYYTCEQIDQRLLQGYFDDIVEAGYTGTKAQYLAGLLKAINYSANPNISAEKVVYDPASSGLSAKNVKAAIDKLSSKVSDLENRLVVLRENEYNSINKDENKIYFVYEEG